MTASDAGAGWRADGKFLRSPQGRVELRAVTYGPFPGGWPEDPRADFARIRQTGFNALRLYAFPPRHLLDAAEEEGLVVFGGLRWAAAADFLRRPGLLSEARLALARELPRLAGHRAMAGLYIGNEIPADLVRRMGPSRVREVLESLLREARGHAPGLLLAYANYPSTEYLEPDGADFTAMNVYLEHEADFRAYLKRLHHIAGDRPLVLSEFGLDSRRNGLARQAEAFRWAIGAARDEGVAGFTAYAWSDRWWNSGAEVTDWDFGLTARDGAEKPALSAVREAFSAPRPDHAPGGTLSVIVCTRNGAARIGACLRALSRQTLADLEVLVVDDGSDDGTAARVAAEFPDFRLLVLLPSGLSAARNAGARAAGGRWIAFTDDDCEPDEDWARRLVEAFGRGWDAVGGPNLPPPPGHPDCPLIAAAPGAPSHVMLDDEQAEHLPGCNLAVKRDLYLALGGCDEAFHTAGDDVDLCWRLRDAGHRLGFAPTAFVWHHRRGSLRGYLRQQLGYGRAERLLRERHPQRFTADGAARWHGSIYDGAPLAVGAGSVIYHGAMGLAGYQVLLGHCQPLRPLPAPHDTPGPRLALAFLRLAQPLLRCWARGARSPLALWRALRPTLDSLRTPSADPADDEWEIAFPSGRERAELLADFREAGWRPGPETATWDLAHGSTRLSLAIERGDEPGMLVLLRRWGPPAPLPSAYHLRR